MGARAFGETLGSSLGGASLRAKEDLPRVAREKGRSLARSAVRRWHPGLGPEVSVGSHSH